MARALIFGGGALAVLGVMLARDEVLVDPLAFHLIEPFRVVSQLTYRLTGTYVNHDVLELLMGALGLAPIAFGVGILVGLGAESPRAPGEPT